MTLHLPDCSFFGPALPEPFVKYRLEALLKTRTLLPKTSGEAGKKLKNSWDIYRRTLRQLGERGGDRRVAHRVLEPLAERLGYGAPRRQDTVITREGAEDGGWLMETGGEESGTQNDDGVAVGESSANKSHCAPEAPPPRAMLRAWALPIDTDLDAPNRRGRAYRFSPNRIAQRVLLATGERAGLLTDGQELRLLICDPARPDSHIAVRLDRAGGWRSAAALPDSYRLLLALACPSGMRTLPELTEAARLAQSEVTKELRKQARRAVEGFIQALLDKPANGEIIAAWDDEQEQAHALWQEGLILIYRLLFLFKLESSADPARAFSFASQSLWRNTYSPNTALAPLVRHVLDEGTDTGGLLEEGLRVLFRMFAEGLRSRELAVNALGGALFGRDTTPLIDSLRWGERAVALLLDNLLWTTGGRSGERERVHYGTLDVEDLGRVYEALLELEPGFADEPMCRLRRAKLEVVVPAAQGERYRNPAPAGQTEKGTLPFDVPSDGPSAAGTKGGGSQAPPPTIAPTKSGKTKVEWIEAIPQGAFYLRVGLGRKASGSYYTPHPFVRFLVQETLGPQIEARSPRHDPHPARLLELTVLDPAMGSGHFLVEACRYLGEALYEACRLCDELAVAAEEHAAKPADSAREEHMARANELRRRVEDLPDPEDELLAYLPSRVPEGEESGLSQRKAEALCRRLVAVHCLYGVDKNPLAVELAKLSLWLESYAEGLPLTFLDHRLVQGDSLTGPFFEHMLTLPGSGAKLDDLYSQELTAHLEDTLADALAQVHDLEATVGKDVADLQHKQRAKEKLDEQLEPFKLLAAAWSGGVMLGKDGNDDGAYQALAEGVASKADVTDLFERYPHLFDMVETGSQGIAFELVFPEVFFGKGMRKKGGFHAVVGNPPWDTVQPQAKEFFAAFDLGVIDAPTKKERTAVEQRLLADPSVQEAHSAYFAEFDLAKRITAKLMEHAGRQAGGRSSGAVGDVWQLFAERAAKLLRSDGHVGYVLPSSFHANQSATGIRELYLNQMALRCCFSFENRRKLFDIHRSFKFAAVVARNVAKSNGSFECAFYLHDLDWLFAERRPLIYTRDFVKKTGGAYLTLIELRSAIDTDIAMTCYSTGNTYERYVAQLGVRTGQELHMTKDSHRFTDTSAILAPHQDPRDPKITAELRQRGYLPLHEGKTFHQFDDRWETRPRYLVAIDRISDKSAWLKASHYYRLAFRDIARSTDERTGIFCLLPPGFVFGHTAACEREAGKRPVSSGLIILSLINAHSFDWNIRQKAAAHVSAFILNGCPVPALNPDQERFLAHAALRLTCNHEGYAPLWTEQLGDTWREPTPVNTWPVLASDEARWQVRAAIDAVVAAAYGLDRALYDHVLKSFSHKSYPQAPKLCLAAFDELGAIGLEAFTKKHDPYFDIPLNEDLPQPVIELPLTAAEPAATVKNFEDAGPLFAAQAARAAAQQRESYTPTPSQEPALVAEDLPAAGDAYARVLELLEQQSVITSRDVQAATGKSAAAVRPLLQRLVDEGRALKEGVRRGTKYRSTSS